MPKPDTTKMINAVQAGYIVQDGVTEVLAGLNAAMNAAVQAQSQGCLGVYVPDLPNDGRVYPYTGIDVYGSGHLIVPKTSLGPLNLCGGTAAGTRFACLPKTYDTGKDHQTFGFIKQDDDTQVWSLSSEGNASKVNGGAPTKFLGNFIRALNDTSSRWASRDLVLTGNVGGYRDDAGGWRESFVISSGLQSVGLYFGQVRARKNVSGISLNGDVWAGVQEAAKHSDPTDAWNAFLSKLTSGHSIVDSEGSNNSGQGITKYGSHDVTTTRFNAFNNGGNGINDEWGYNNTDDTPTSHDNGLGAYGGFGDGAGCLILNPNFYNNDQKVPGQAQAGELYRVGCAWWQGNPPPFGFVRDVTVKGGKITPRTGGYHVAFDVRDMKTRAQPAVTWPAPGPYAMPKVAFSGVSGLTDPSKVILNGYFCQDMTVQAS